MRTIERSTTFKHDYQRESKGQHRATSFGYATAMLDRRRIGGPEMRRNRLGRNLRREQERRNGRRYEGGDLADAIVRDRPGTGRHPGDQAERIGASGNRCLGFSDGSDAAHFDPGSHCSCP